MEVPADQRNWFKLQMLLTKIEENLRDLFTSRWRIRFAVDWRNSRKDRSRLVKIMGEDLNLIGNTQRRIVQLGEVGKWDISTISKILYAISDDSKKVEDAKIREIVEIRNILAHHPDKIIPRGEFDQMWSKLEPISKDFGLSNFEINGIYFGNNSNEEILEEFDKLKTEGNNLFRDSKIPDAIKSYSMALVLPSLTNEQLGTIYSNRSAAYLKLNDEQSYKLALEDAKACKRIRPTWFKSHLRFAQAEMALKNYSSALNAYDQAVGLEPNNEEIATARNYCRICKVQQDTRMNLDPSCSNMSLRDAAKEESQRTGMPFEKVLQKLHEEEDSIIKSESPDGYYALANRYRTGIQVEFNPELAAKFYAKAAQEGHMDARFELGSCMINGLGIPMDIKGGISMLKELANDEKNFKGGHIPTGIISAQYSLGVIHHNGMGVPISPATAIFWYKKAADNKCGMACTNLGFLYYEGYHVERDEKKAVQYWERAAMTCPPTPRALELLACHYLSKGMMKEAEIYWRRGKEHCNQFTILSEKEFQKYVKGDAKFQMFQNRSSPFLNFQSLEKVLSSDLIQAKEDGSIFAERIFYSANHLSQALLPLVQGLKGISNENWNYIILNLGKCIEAEEYIAMIPIHFSDGILNASKKIMGAGKITELDKCARLCHYNGNLHSLKEMGPFLDACISKYPQVAKFYEFKLGVFGLLNEIKEGLAKSEEYLQIIPQDLGITFWRFAFASRIESNFDLAIRTCNDFLHIAPEDHRHVPLCHYIIGQRYLAKSKSFPKLKKKAKEYYEKGLEAEKLQFSMFLPYNSREKDELEGIFGSQELKCNGNEAKSLDPKDDDLISQLLHPNRVAIIKKHRMILKVELNMELFRLQKNYPKSSFSCTPAREQNIPKSLAGLTEITLMEIDPAKDQIYDKMLINLQVVERPIESMSKSLCMVVEDVNRHVITLAVHNFDRDRGVDEHFGIGAKMTILNPYGRMALDGSYSLRVDNPKSIFFLEDDRSKKLCTFCGKPESKNVCKKCMQSNYCSKECQVNDWKVLKHKWVCKQNYTNIEKLFPKIKLHT